MQVRLEVLARQARCFFCADPLTGIGETVFVESYHTGIMHPAHALCTIVRHPVRSNNAKFGILVRGARCRACGEALERSAAMQFDHRPPLEQRRLNRRKTDYSPRQHDPDWIEAIHVECHQQRTFGRKPGAERTVTTAGSDAHVAAKVRRINKAKKPGRKIPSRPFPKKRRQG